MFVPSSIYLDTLKQLLEQPGPLCLAVAFWGRSAVKVMPADRSIRLLCNLHGGGTNPFVIDTFLRNHPGIEVRHDPRLHAKVTLTQQAALIGSANISANGLNLEDAELSGWIEAGWLTDDAAQLRRIRYWFDALWEASAPVLKDDISAAKRAWKQRRAARPISGVARAINLFSLKECDLKDRDISLVLYRDEVDPKERAEITRHRKELALPPIKSDTPLFTGWPLAKPRAIVVSFRYPRRGALTWDGLFEVEHTMEVSKSGRTTWHWVCSELKSLAGAKIDKNATLRTLRPHVADVWAQAEPQDDEGRMIPLIQALRICQSE